MSRGAITLFSYQGSKLLPFCSAGDSSKMPLLFWTHKLQLQLP
jgi:hypothetical protein